MIMNNMKKISTALSLLGVFLLPVAAMAATGLANKDATGGAVGTAMGNILGFISGYVIPFILAIGFLMVVWGIFQYFIVSSDEAKENGKNMIFYAVAGFVLILSFWGIVLLLTDGIGFGGGTITAPSAKFW
jgi:hypothetical protein